MANSAKKYAQALFSAVQDENTLKRVHEDFEVVMKSIENVPGFNDFMENPRIRKESRKALIETTFKGVEKPLLNTLLILSDKNKLNELSDVHAAFVDEYNKHENQQYVVVESTYKLSAEELDEIGKYFINKTGYEKLLIDNKVNEELIGGIKVFIGTRVYDGSVSGQLESLQNQFKERTNS
ncbi:ATP synthase F1 subunit delta [Corticicoccus populi]|uniref:ATP synthase subunit delta n=1 Tax=Corticicoccus populi TaxID=1812821 RepID=A0ABW5WZF0_9STAP